MAKRMKLLDQLDEYLPYAAYLALLVPGFLEFLGNQVGPATLAVYVGLVGILIKVGKKANIVK